MNEFREMIDALDKCCQFALRQIISDKQVFLKTDASFQVMKKLHEQAKHIPQLNTVPKLLLLHKWKFPIMPQNLGRCIWHTKKLDTFSGITETCYFNDRQKSSTTIFSNQNDSTTIMERVWFCPTNQFYRRTYCWQNEHRCWLFMSLTDRPKWKKYF